MKHILVVEDDPVIRENISDILEEEFNITAACDGKEATEILKSNSNFDLILSDIMMPNVDGYAVYDFVKHETSLKEIPFIFLTAKTDNKSVRKGMNLGVEDYITKPFKINDLISAVKVRLLKQEEQKRKFDNLKESISLYVPHELRTPLVSIIGNSDLIENYYDDFSKEELLEIIKSINSAGNRLKRSVEKFLKYADITIQKANGFVEEEFEPFYSNRHNCKTELNHCYDCKARLKDIKMNFENGLLKISQIDFETILVEVVSNACKFSEEGTPILVKGEIFENKYRVVVTDYGRGISNDEIDSISGFVQFKRKIYQQSGNGIGFAIVKLICEKYDVSFKIESKLNEFTSVTFLFNLEKEDENK